MEPNESYRVTGPLAPVSGPHQANLEIGPHRTNTEIGPHRTNTEIGPHRTSIRIGPHRGSIFFDGPLFLGQGYISWDGRDRYRYRLEYHYIVAYWLYCCSTTRRHIVLS